METRLTNSIQFVLRQEIRRGICIHRFITIYKNMTNYNVNQDFAYGYNKT